MIKVLITGGAGYIGSILSEELLKNDYQVTVVDNFMYNQTSLNHIIGNKKIEVINSDVRNLIISGGTEKEIESKAKEAGMLNLSEVGVNLLKNGTISFGELERVISE